MPRTAVLAAAAALFVSTVLPTLLRADLPPGPPPSPAEPPVERIAELQRSVAEDARQIKSLRDSLHDPDGEYRAAETEFRELDAQVERKTREAKRLADRKDEAGAERAGKELEALREPRERAARRFAAAVTERKQLQEKIAALEGRLAERQEELDKLLGVDVQGRVSRLRQKAESEEADLARLRTELAQGAGAHLRLEEEARADDAAFRAKLTALQELRQDPKAAEGAVAGAEAAVKAAADKAFESKKAFDRSVRRRSALQERVADLEARLAADRLALARLVAPQPGGDAPTPPAGGDPKGAGAAGKPPAPGGPPAAPPGGGPGPAGTVLAGNGPAAPAAGTASGTAKDAAARPGGETGKAPSARVKAAREAAEARREAARRAAEELAAVDRRVADLGRLIAAERALLATARTRLQNAVEERDALAAKVQARAAAGATAEEIRGLLASLGEASKRAVEARAAVNRATDQLERLYDESQALQAEQVGALRAAEARKAEADEAERAVERLDSPFDPVNIAAFVAERGPRILVIVLIMVAFQRLAGRAVGRIVRFVAGNGSPENLPEREARARTMVGVFHNAAGVAILMGGSLMVLDELGVNVALLMGGAAVVGLAVAFGAQNLVRDYFSGFVILLENQYMVNDVVRFSNLGLAGLVERITLRLTVLRDIDGVVHFVPNGQIVTVTNMTHDYSRALFDIPVAHGEDVDRAIGLLRELALDMRKDPVWGPLLLADPEMLGVERITDIAFVIRFFINTKPIRQWDVMRELNKRILRRFGELGIRIPVPQQVVTLRGLPDAGSPSAPVPALASASPASPATAAWPPPTPGSPDAPR